MFTLEDGKIAVRMARANIERKLGAKDVIIPKPPESFDSESGVFVTLNTYPSHQLRGCIGYSEPVMPLKNAILDASISSAMRDPRFPPVTLKEMASIVVEVTLLTPPEDIRFENPEDLKDKVIVGKHGLIARRSFMSGLLLPQVPVEWNWDVEEFLSHTCRKAGLDPNEWRTGKVHFQRFEGRVFGEISPRGEVSEVELK
ncbi:MAG: TIGR00296 family protein [Thermoplasmata archaeon]|nr:MAG: AMMECR1 domain-containing protein [Thermoplasmatales archaeon ex4484_6]RLF51147.1 MAG: TIGR00296 family protein [Thermoplasmata archaeon]RLF66367.1 MAG: TIGR00296 family protein [Thermoplasmata archaeon]